MSKLSDGTPAPKTLEEAFDMVRVEARKLERESASTKGKHLGGISAETQTDAAYRHLSLHENTMSSAAQRLFEIMRHAETLTAKPELQKQVDLQMVAKNDETASEASTQMR